MTIINKNTALTTARDILVAAAPRGTKPFSMERLQDTVSGDYLSLEVERAWTVGCTINVTFAYGERRKFRIADGTAKPSLPRHSNKGDAEVTIPTYAIKVEVNWSSCGRNVATAQAAVALYQECINIAAELEAALAGAVVYCSSDLDFEMSHRDAPAPTKKQRTKLAS